MQQDQSGGGWLGSSRNEVKGRLTYVLCWSGVCKVGKVNIGDCKIRIVATCSNKECVHNLPQLRVDSVFAHAM